MTGADLSRDRDTAAKVDFLSDPGTYIHAGGTDAVRVCETHLSWVFLADRLVYKLKKPASYPFVDLSTLAARVHNCSEELRLNRMLAADVYLGLSSLCWQSGFGFTLDGEGEMVDVLVRMRRLPERLCLEHQVRAGTISALEVTVAAKRLARFYAAQPIIAPADLSVLARQLRQEARELDDVLDTHGQADALLHTLLQTIEEKAVLLGGRGRREVHGDLRAQHVYLGREPVFIDRLEFSRELRLMDPAEELSFLLLECRGLGAEWVGQRFLEVYTTVCGDMLPTGLTAFYLARRALLWALLGARHVTRDGDMVHWETVASDFLDHGLNTLRAARA